MNKAGTQTIETSRLILRRFVIEDAEDMYSNWCCDYFNRVMELKETRIKYSRCM